MEKDRGRPVRRPLFVRCPQELREQLLDRARESERSLTAEVIYRLRQSLRPANEAAA
jgi:hypothetical protein